MEATVKRKSIKSRNRNLNPLVLFLFSILIVYVVVFTFMLLWAFMNSFKPLGQWENREYMAFPDFSNPLWTSKEMRYDMKGNQVMSTYYPSALANYTRVLEAMPGKGEVRFYAGWDLNTAVVATSNNSLFMMIFNTIFYSFVGSLIIAVVPCVVGYLAAKYPYKFSSLLYVLALFVMIMPLVGTEPARIKLLCRLYLFDTMWGDFIVNFTFANMYFLVFYAFYSGVSGTFAEAAEVDGASQLRTMVQIIMPLASKMIATVLLIFFIGRWNNYTTPLVYMPTKWMLSYRLFQITIYKDEVGGDPAKIAGAMIIVVPILVMFIFLKDKIMGNISMGGVKE